MVAALLRINKIAAATHNMMADRIFIPDKNTFLQASACFGWEEWEGHD